MNITYIVISIHTGAVRAIPKHPESGGIAGSTAGARRAPLAAVVAGDTVSRT